MDITNISDLALGEEYQHLNSLRKDDGSFEDKKDEHNFIIGREEIIRRWFYEK